MGYTNASWTLKADLICAYVCRLLNYLDQHGFNQVTPRLNDLTVERLPLLNLSSGYVTRALDRLPQQGSRAPWRLYQNYLMDMMMIRFRGVRDEALEFKRSESPAPAGEAVTA
jgi:hypothetical protein